MKRLVLFVEGEGESEAAPKLVKQLMTEQNAWDAVFLDLDPFRVGQVTKLVKQEYREWKQKLAACLKRRNVGGVLVILDGDFERLGSVKFCAANAAKALAKEATALGAGIKFSVAVVFARQEFESWLIAGVESMAGKSLADGRKIASDVKAPDGDLENSPRDAKGWFRKIVEGGYRPTRDQAALTELVELQSIRSRGLRTFKRLESAVSQLIASIRSDTHVATPC